MYYVWVLMLTSGALVALTVLAGYLAVKCNFIEIEFRSLPPSIRIVARR